MQKTKIVKEVLLEYMENKGYSYQYDQEMWIFEKQEEILKKHVCIMDIHKQFVKFDFSTNAYGQRPVEGLEFMNTQEVQIDTLWRCCAYKNEDDFTRIICEIKRVIEEKGDEIFARISEPTTEVIPTPELQKQLFENHEELAVKGKEFLGIDNKQGREKIEILAKRLEWTRKTKTFQEVQDELIMLSAVFGEIYREQSKGRWSYRNNVERCCVEGKMNLIVSPLNLIFGAWEHGNYYNLNASYREAENVHNKLSGLE